MNINERLRVVQSRKEDHIGRMKIGVGLVQDIEWMHDTIKQLQKENERLNMTVESIRELNGAKSDQIIEQQKRIEELERKVKILRSAKEACDRNDGAMKKLAGFEPDA